MSKECPFCDEGRSKEGYGDAEYFQPWTCDICGGSGYITEWQLLSIRFSQFMADVTLWIWENITGFPTGNNQED